jgi:pyruvate kinase
VNLPNTAISLPSLTEKDRKDLEFAVSQKVNWIALSFVRSAEDLKILRKTINELSDQGFKPKIIAKIEKPEALVNIDAIIQETDGVMVARGDLGVELPLEQVPLVQKTLVNKCVKASKPVIIATQMMEGMITNIRPTRAEVNDVANSVLDGADALMLSGETSVGEFPVEVIKTMKKIILEVENFQDIYDKPHSPDLSDKERIISDSILFAACNIANEANARAIIAMTHTGYSAFRISSRRPRQDIYIFSTSHELLCMLNLVWGVKGVYLSEVIQSTSRTLKMIADKLLSDGSVAHGDLLVNVTSTPVYVSGKTNMVKLSFA